MGLTKYRIRKTGRKRKRKIGELRAIFEIYYYWQIPD